MIIGLALVILLEEPKRPAKIKLKHRLSSSSSSHLSLLVLVLTGQDLAVPLLHRETEVAALSWEMDMYSSTMWLNQTVVEATSRSTAAWETRLSNGSRA